MATNFNPGKKRTNHGRGIQQKDQERRRAEAEERAAEWEKLSPQEKLAALDKRLGVGVGAEKQRAKLAALINAPKILNLRIPNPMQLANEAVADAVAPKRAKTNKHSKQAPPVAGEYTSKKK